MSRADDLRARYEAEAAVLDLEDRLAAAKEAGEVTRELKEALRAARAALRAEREGVVSPAVIEVTAAVSDLGG